MRKFTVIIRRKTTNIGFGRLHRDAGAEGGDHSASYSAAVDLAGLAFVIKRAIVDLLAAFENRPSCTAAIRSTLIPTLMAARREIGRRGRGMGWKIAASRATSRDRASYEQQVCLV